jgi:hypothetical protein
MLKYLKVEICNQLLVDLVVIDFELGRDDHVSNQIKLVVKTKKSKNLYLILQKNLILKMYNAEVKENITTFVFLIVP